MSKEDARIALKFRKLAKRLHRGWAELHPATTKELEAVRRAVRLQWEQAQKVTQGATKSGRTAGQEKGHRRAAGGKGVKRELPPDQSQPPRDRSREQDLGHSH